MNEEKKQIDWLRVIVLVALVIMLIAVGVEQYNSLYWKEKFTYEKWEFYDYESVENGRGCMLDNCNEIKTEYKTHVKECICKDSNKIVRVIATSRTPYYDYTKFKPLKYEVKINETI